MIFAEEAANLIAERNSLAAEVKGLRESKTVVEECLRNLLRGIYGVNRVSSDFVQVNASRALAALEGK